MNDRHDELIRLRPWEDLVVVSHGRLMLATDRDGFFDGGPNRGLFVHETRLLSRHRFSIDGRPPKPVALSNVTQGSWTGYYVLLPPGADPGEKDEGSGHMDPASEKTLELLLTRTVSSALREDVALTNFSQEATAFELSIDLDADFADQGETMDGRRQHGEIERRWRERDGAWELSFQYFAENNRAENRSAWINRGVRIRVAVSDSPPSCGDDGLTFRVELPPLGTWRARLEIIPEIVDVAGGVGRDVSEKHERFLAESTRFSTPECDTLSPSVVRALEQARRDLASLRLGDLDEDENSWTLGAGLPLYVALYGRDALSASWQAALLGPDMMDGSLRALARLQGREVDDWRDEQPGRMLHEAHTGPVAALNFNPRGRYYGSVTTSGFYPLLVSELWHWTGDRERVRPFVRPALDALRWLERFSDRSGDGFYDYQTRSSEGVLHQAWKDSPDAIVDEDGAPVSPPIATCEEQAFVYVAKLHLSETLWWLDEKDEARRLFHEAGELKKRFNEVFWMEEEGFFAMGLDAEGRPIRSIGSNPGHCLASGIVDSSLAERTARRLMADDLWSGWGVRTLSDRHPAYNPYSYHHGSVWPVENASFALGFMRFGLHAELETICRGMFEAARLFDFHRLPEAFSGHARDAEHPFPALYPQANSPQAWSASAVFCMLQSLLGIYPYAPLKMLLVDPHLPPWLPEITVTNLKVGEARVTLRFYRQEKAGKGEASTYEILDQQGTLHVLRQPSPWSLTASFAERLKDALSSLLPGK